VTGTDDWMCYCCHFWPLFVVVLARPQSVAASPMSAVTVPFLDFRWSRRQRPTNRLFLLQKVSAGV
jgi:hypothetical protein